MSNTGTKQTDKKPLSVDGIVKWLFGLFGILFFAANMPGRKWNEFSFTILPLSGSIIIGLGWFVVQFAKAKKYKSFCRSIKTITGNVSYFPFSKTDVEKYT